MKGIRARKLRKSKTNDLFKEEIKNLRDNARSFYNDYIKGTSVIRDDLGKINFSDAGIDEQVSKGLHNANVIPDLKKQIKTGKKQAKPRNDYPRDDIKHFHIIDNKINNKNIEYQIAEDVNGNKYYFAKDVTKNEGLPPTNQNQNLGSEISPTNIITDNADNFNPNANIKLGDDIPENLKKTLPTHREQLEKALGLTEENWDQEPNFYSKEKEDEAYAILSQATGKSIKWLKSQLKTGKNGKGTAKRREFIELLLEHTDDKLDGYPNGKYYFTFNIPIIILCNK